MRDLPSMQGQTMIAIKAPSGTRLEVPDPDEVTPARNLNFIFLFICPSHFCDIRKLQED